MNDQDEAPLIEQAALDEVFERNPLKQVAFEVRYPFDLQVKRDMCEVQKRLRKNYPRFLAAEIEGVEGSPAQVHTFASEDGSRSVRVAEDRFIIVYTRYEHYEGFKEEALNQTRSFCQQFGISQFQRVGLRYVNHIEVPKEGPTYQVSKVVRPYFDIKRATATGPMRFQMELTIKKPTCLLTLRSAFSGKPPEQANAVYLLDLDAYVHAEPRLDDLEKIADELHRQVQIEFLGHVTEECKQAMRGKS